MSDKVLDMLEQGEITSEQAARLLEALRKEEQIVGDSSTCHEPDQVVPASPPPQVAYWRYLRYIPIVVAVAVLSLTAWWLYRVFLRSEGRITLLWVWPLIFFGIAAALSAFAAWLLRAPWLHLRVRQENGRTIAISLPLPLTLASWGIAIAERFVDQETAAHLRASADMLRVMRHDRRKGEPIAVDIDQDEEHVQIYID